MVHVIKSETSLFSVSQVNVLNTEEQNERIDELIDTKLESEIINRRRVMPKDLKIPEYLLCPITGKLMQHPVMIESGVTFEKKIIRAHFHNG